MSLSRSRHEKISGLHLLYLWIICYDEQSSFKGQLSQVSYLHVYHVDAVALAVEVFKTLQSYTNFVINSSKC